MLIALKGINLALAFVLELAALAAFAYFGYQAGQVALSILLPVIGIALWAIFGAPRSKRRLRGIGLLLFRIVFFGAGALALIAANQVTLGIMFGVICALNIGLIYFWKQDEVDQVNQAA